METISSVVRNYSIPIVKISSGQRIVLVGIKPDEIDSVWADLKTGIGRALEPCLHYVQACPGTSVCRFGQKNSLEMGMKLENILYDLPTAAKLKIGVSGCPFNCGEAFTRDIGLTGTVKGWKLVFGGNSGRAPRIGDVVKEELSEEDAIDLVKRFIKVYTDNANPKDRTARFIEKFGIENFKNKVFES
jgi:NAD(P)H-nitrite reductase large subunit